MGLVLCLLVCVVPVLTKVQNSAGQRGKNTNVVESKIAVPIGFESVPILDPAVDVDGPNAGSYIGDFSRSECAIKPKSFIKRAFASESSGEMFLYDRYHKQVFIYDWNHGDMHPLTTL